MPRAITLTVSPDRSEALLEDLRDLDLLSLRLHRSASLRPPGDQIELEITVDALPAVMRIVDDHGLGRPGGVAMTTSVPLSVVSPTHGVVSREHAGTSWEELELELGEESTMSAARVVVMAIAGFVAGIGLLSGAVHLVVGAMVIAPGFQPFARITLGIVSRTAAWRDGITDVVRGYAALVVGAAAAGLVGLLFGAPILGAGADSYLPSSDLVAYWTTTEWTGVAVAAVASIGGGLLVSINRLVLTAGVMVALALVPTAALVPLALIGGQPGLARAALGRFSVEAVLVLAGSAVVFAFKRRRDRRGSRG